MAEIKNLKRLEYKLNLRIKQAQREARQTVVVGYTAAYAIYVHENTQMKLKGKPRPKNRGMYWDPQGKAQPKFLERPARTMQKELAQIVTQVTQATGSVIKGMYAAGLRLQRESQGMVPVDTGNLKNSAFTRIEGE